MQKRLLALVATVAMVLSMFAGIAFAAGATVETIAIDSAKIEGNVLSGQVTVAFTEGDITDQKANLSFKLGADTVVPEEFATTDNKVYTFKYTAVTEYAADSYTLTVSHNQVTPEVADATKAITVAPYVNLDPAAYDQTTGSITVTGKTNIKSVTEITVSGGLVTTPATIALPGADGAFTFDLPGDTAPGAYTVTVTGVDTLSTNFTVNPLDSLTVTITSATEFVTGSVGYHTIAGNTNIGGATITVDGITTTPVEVKSDADGLFSFQIPANTEAGTYTVKATKGALTGTATFTMAAANAYTMNLSTTKIISSGSAAEFQPIVGSITRTGTQSGGATNFILVVSYKDYEKNPATMEVQVPNGQFSFYLPTNIPLQDVTFNLWKTNDAWAQVEEITTATELAKALPKLKVRYNVTLNPSTLEFPYTGTQSPVAITGKVADSKGNPVEGKLVTLSAPGAAALTQTTTKTGEFGFVVLEWKQVGKIKLMVNEGVNGFVHVEGEVTPKTASLSVTPKSAVHSLKEFEFIVKGANFPLGAPVSVALYKGDKDITSSIASGTLSATATDGTFETKFYWQPSEAGTYTVKAEGAKHGASATITVTNPLSYNFINSEQLTTLPVKADLALTFGTSGTYLMKYDGKTTTTNFVYDVFVDGVQKVTKEATATVKVPTTKLGTKTFRVIAYTSALKDGKTVYTKEYEQTFVGQITGWDVTMEPAALTVNKAENISFVIKDKDGVPVNNATIYIDEKVYASPSTHNAQDGTYVLKDVKFSTVGPKTVVVSLGAKTEKTTRATLKLDVVGEKVYDVTADVDTLLQGKAQDVKLTVTRDGKAVIPQRIKVVEKKLDPKEVSFTPLADGVTKINVKAVKAGELIVRAENYDGTLCGEVVINVVAPKLVLIDEEAVNVTDNFKTDVHFKVVDPRDDSVIKSNLFVSGAYLTGLELYNEHGGSIVGSDGVFTILGAEEHKVTILAKDGLYDDAVEDEETVLVALNVGAADGALVDGSFEVKEATIESDPAMIIVGAQNNLTLTYKDANGKLIVGKVIKAGEASLGKTDDNGQAIYPVGVPTGAVELTADTDVKDTVVKHTIKVGYDAEAPKVTYDEESKTAKVTIVISDNVRLARIEINGEKIDFWAGPTYEHDVTLKSGVNKFHIKAQDTNYNVFDEVIEITLVEEGIKMVAGETTYVANGETKELAAAPYREGDYIMIAARVLEAFDAEFAWNGEAKTATFKLDGKVVTVTANSLNATVDGETVLMPVAGKIVNDRMMVPIRFVTENLGFTLHWAAGDILTLVR